MVDYFFICLLMFYIFDEKTLQPGIRLGDSLKGSVLANHNTTTLDAPVNDVICGAS